MEHAGSDANSFIGVGDSGAPHGDLGGGVDGGASVVNSRDGVRGVCSAAGFDSVCGGNAGDVRSEATSGWTRRVRIGKAPIERAPNPDGKSALELSLRSYAERKHGMVVDPAIGTSFDSLEVRIRKAPIERAPNPDRKSALEMSLRLYAERKQGLVVDPAIGTSFDYVLC